MSLLLGGVVLADGAGGRASNLLQGGGMVVLVILGILVLAVVAFVVFAFISEPAVSMGLVFVACPVLGAAAYIFGAPWLGYASAGAAGLGIIGAMFRNN